MSRRRALFLAFRTVQFAVLFGLPALFVGEGNLTWPRYGVIAVGLALLAAVHHRVHAAARQRPDGRSLVDAAAALEAGAFAWLLWTTVQWSAREPLFTLASARFLLVFLILYQLKRRRMLITMPSGAPSDVRERA